MRSSPCKLGFREEENTSLRVCTPNGKLSQSTVSFDGDGDGEQTFFQENQQHYPGLVSKVNLLI
jgi:hypothetical protein